MNRSLNCTSTQGLRAYGVPSARAGFSLLELIVVISIIALLAGMALPLASITLNSAARKATQGEFETLSLAVSEYFRDTWELPTELVDLNVDPGVTGWAGPYVVDAGIDTISDAPQYTVDGWSQPYELAPTASSLTLTSGGSDRVTGNDDDLTWTVEVTPIRREFTLERLRTINQAITLYNASYQGTDPLPADIDLVLTSLVARGFLPSATGYREDGWGVPFEECPAGIAPVVRLISTTLQGGSCP